MNLTKSLVFMLGASVVTINVVNAHSLTHETVIQKNLANYEIPFTPNLLDGNSLIIVDKTAAIQLGKALFWDTNVGSHGVACATCHFHAGADGRTRNQLNPGMLNLKDATSGNKFDLPKSGEANYTLKATDFPFFKFKNVNDKKSITSQTDDVVGSAGTYKQIFTSLGLETDEEDCQLGTDPIHHVGDAQTRQTTKRNAPSVINAIFNHRNFWDGRANNEFNGVSPFGPRDKNAKIWVVKNGKAVSQKLSLVNASLASQALGPPTDMIEMSCNGRTFKDIAKKLLHQNPLSNQEINAEDSVLASLRNTSGFGLSNTYEELIKKSFNPIYWSSNAVVQRIKGTNYSQMEANFSFFFGLAIQMYESTLVSNQTKFDLALPPMKTNDVLPPTFTEQEKRGLVLFSNAHCDLCHSGAFFSSAVNRETDTPGIYQSFGSAYIDRVGFVPSNSNTGVDATLADVGFFNTSVVPDDYDIGLGGTDPWGNPLSYSTQYVDSIGLKTKKFVDHFIVSPCDFTQPFSLDFKSSELKKISSNSIGCNSVPKEYANVPKPSIVTRESLTLNQGRLSTLTIGAFKIPTLRNVELTGPYMHNGGMKSLEEVIDFYNRGGNVQNRRHAATLVFPQGFNDDDKDALVAFLKTLTDERVRWEKAPFDHPSIKVPNGHKETANGGLMEDNYLEIPAVGKNGAAKPLLPFENYLK